MTLAMVEIGRMGAPNVYGLAAGCGGWRRGEPGTTIRPPPSRPVPQD